MIRCHYRTVITRVSNTFKTCGHWSSFHKPVASPRCNNGEFNHFHGAQFKEGQAENYIRERGGLSSRLPGASQDENRQCPHTFQSALLRSGVLRGGTLSILVVKILKYKEVKWHIQVKLPISSQRDGATCLSLSGGSGQAGINSESYLSQEPKVIIKLTQPQQRTKYAKLSYQYLGSPSSVWTPYDHFAMNLKAYINVSLPC